MSEAFEIIPKSNIGPFKLGMKKNDILNLKRCPVISYYQSPNEKIRSDDFTLIGLHVHYDENLVISSRIVIFTKVSNKKVIDISVFSNVVNDFIKEEIVLLLQENKIDFLDNGEKILCKELGLVFGFRFDGICTSGSDKVEYVYIDRN